MHFPSSIEVADISTIAGTVSITRSANYNYDSKAIQE